MLMLCNQLLAVFDDLVFERGQPGYLVVNLFDMIAQDFDKLRHHDVGPFGFSVNLLQFLKLPDAQAQFLELEDELDASNEICHKGYK